jgi:hypothetical protein
MRVWRFLATRLRNNTAPQNEAVLPFGCESNWTVLKAQQFVQIRALSLHR